MAGFIGSAQSSVRDAIVSQAAMRRLSFFDELCIVIMLVCAPTPPTLAPPSPSPLPSSVSQVHSRPLILTSITQGAVSTVTAQNTTVSSDSDSNSWHGWWQQEQTPTWDSDLGCFLDDQQCAGTRAELNDLGWYRVQDSPFDGFFDGTHHRFSPNPLRRDPG
jgi:hypothetical protein